MIFALKLNPCHVDAGRTNLRKQVSINRIKSKPYQAKAGQIELLINTLLTRQLPESRCKKVRQWRSNLVAKLELYTQLVWVWANKVSSTNKQFVKSLKSTYKFNIGRFDIFLQMNLLTPMLSYLDIVYGCRYSRCAAIVIFFSMLQNVVGCKTAFDWSSKKDFKNGCLNEFRNRVQSCIGAHSKRQWGSVFIKIPAKTQNWEVFLVQFRAFSISFMLDRQN